MRCLFPAGVSLRCDLPPRWLGFTSALWDSLLVSHRNGTAVQGSVSYSSPQSNPALHRACNLFGCVGSHPGTALASVDALVGPMLLQLGHNSSNQLRLRDLSDCRHSLCGEPFKHICMDSGSYGRSERALCTRAGDFSTFDSALYVSATQLLAARPCAHTSHASVPC